MPTATDTVDPPPPPPPPAAVPSLWRSRHDRYLAGVGGGVGERLGVDPFFVRVSLVIATLLLAGADAPPLAAAAYAGAWLAVPERGGRPLLSRVSRDTGARREAAVAVLLLGATAILVPRLGPGGSPGLRLGVTLMGLAVLLLATHPRSGEDGPADPAVRSEAGPGDAPAMPPDTPADQRSPQPTTVEAAGATATAATPVVRRRPGQGTPLSLAGAWASRSRPPRRLRRPRREPALWPLTVSALLLYGVVCAIADHVLDPGLDPGVAVSGALLIVAAVLVLSTWRGRARSTIALGVALLPVWAGFTLTGIDRYPGIGDRTFRPTTQSAAEAGFEMGYGRAVVDLREVPLPPGGELRTTLGLTAGAAQVRVPADAFLVVTGDIGLGSISVNRYSRWDAAEEGVVDRTLDRRYEPIPSTCTLQPVATDGLVFTNGDYPTTRALDAELRRRGWPVSRTTDPPSPDAPGDWVLVGVDEQWQLCDASGPALPDDPATIVLDVHVGIGTLEIIREHP